jgi:hypothetical protein
MTLVANHPRDACIHLFFIKEFATSNLIDSQLHLRVEPGLVGKKPIHCIDNQLVGSATRALGKVSELGGLAFGNLEFHS